MRVDLPAPLGPSSPKNSPSPIVRSTPFSASVPVGYRLTSCSIERASMPLTLGTEGWPGSALRLPERQLAGGGGGDDAPPPGRPLPRREEDPSAELLRLRGGAVDPLDLDVRQPERLRGAALDEPAGDRAPRPAHRHRLVGPVARVDRLRPPPAEAPVKRPRALQVAGVELEMDHGPWRVS